MLKIPSRYILLKDIGFGKWCRRQRAPLQDALSIDRCRLDKTPTQLGIYVASILFTRTGGHVDSVVAKNALATLEQRLDTCVPLKGRVWGVLAEAKQGGHC